MEEIVRTIMAGATVALGVVPSMISEGMIAKAAMEAIGRNPEAASKVSSNMILGMAIVETGAIFALVMGLIIKFV